MKLSSRIATAFLLLLGTGGGVAFPQESAVPVASENFPEPAAPAAAEEPGTESPIQIHGFLATIASGLVAGERPASGQRGDFLLGEERFRLDLSGASSTGELSVLIKGDAYHDAISSESGVDFREAWIGYTSGETDVRIGRQILTWGVGDLLFINDVFPKDWESFFAGRPIDYIKVPVDGLRVRRSWGALDGEIVLLPVFAPDKLPSLERFPLDDPHGGATGRNEELPPLRYSNVEWAVRLHRRIGEVDFTLYGDRGFWRIPSARADEPAPAASLTLFYPRLSVYGASAQLALWEGVLSFETGYYDSRDDRAGRDPAIPNSETRMLAGYQWQAGEELTAGVQLYGEVMSDASAYAESVPTGSPRLDRIRGVASLRLTKWFAYQTTRLSLFVAASPTDEDYFFQAEAFHKLTDSVGVALGANVFGGKERTTPFGRLGGSDNVFGSVRFDF